MSNQLLKYLFHRPTFHKLPVLPRMYSTEYQPTRVDPDTSTLMKLSHTRCPQGVEILKHRHGQPSARALIEKLPPRRRKRRVGARLAALLRRAFGVTAYDPMKSIARQHMRTARRDGRR